MAYRNGLQGNPHSQAGGAYSPGMPHAQVPQVSQPAMNAYGAHFAPPQQHTQHPGQAMGYGGAPSLAVGGGSGVPHYAYTSPAQASFPSNQGA